MGSEQVHVQVVNGDRRVDGPILRPVRLMPGGHAGVVYGGEVYPLYVGNRVDVTDSPAGKFDCPEFVPPGGTIPYARRTATRSAGNVGGRALLGEQDWHVESNRFGHYLIFDADEAVAERVVDAIDASPLGVRRWDASHRPADNGRLYDWFVRLHFDGQRMDCLRLVRLVLSPAPQPDVQPLALDDSFPAHLRPALVSALQKALQAAQENNGLSEQVATLQGHLAEREVTYEKLLSKSKDRELELEGAWRAQAAEISALQEAAVAREEQHRSVLERSREAHTLQIDRLEEEVRLLRLSPPSTSQPESGSSSLESHQGQLRSQQQEIDELYAFWNEATSQGNLLQRKLDTATAKNAALAEHVTALEESVRTKTSKLAEVSDEQRERRTAEREKSHSRKRPNLERFLNGLFRRLVLDHESVETLLEFERPAKAVRELMRIDNDDPQLRAVAKAVRGYDGWWELSKVHTGANGKSAMGRIYYRPHDGEVIVKVHRKTDDDEQRRFMAQRLTLG